MARTEYGLILLLLAALSGCSLIVQEVILPACTDDAECEVLNVTPGGKTITTCLRYQCDGNAGRPGTCVYRPRDADDDGQTSAMCPNGNDCDDSNDAVFVGNAEICDGLDNDCDLVIDDGDIGAEGAAELRNVTGANSVTWGTGGSATYSTSTTTFMFNLEADGTLTPAREVRPSTNARCPDPPTTCTGGGGWLQLTSQETVEATCAGRGAEWLATTECTDDTECFQPVCIRADGGGGTAPIGRCTDLDGGYMTQCREDKDCAWPCASERCVPPARDDVQPRAGCTLFDLATSPIGNEGAFAVGIETSGCRAGRLRAGWLVAAGDLLMFGPEARSNVWLGIDVGAFPTDGGASRDVACSGADRASGTPGAARPAVAALGPEPPEALTVYLGDTRERDRCGSAMAVPVEGLALLRETGSRPQIPSWVTASNDGHPETFGETNGGGAPAVAAVGEVGWIVGYPQATPTGGTPIALHYIGRLARPMAYTERLPDGGGVWPAHSRRETAPLAPSAPFFEVPAAGRADYVNVAVGALRGQAYDIGVTWMEGCAGTDMESVWFSLVRFDPAMPGAATATDPVQLSTGAALGGFPSIVYARNATGGASPFVSVGWSRAAGTPVATDALGGFVVAWAGSGRMNPSTSVYAVRVSESDGLPIDAAPLPLEAVDTVPRAASVSLYATADAPNGNVSFAYWNQEVEIAGGRLICPAM